MGYLTLKLALLSLVITTFYLYFMQPRGDDWQIAYILVGLFWLGVATYWVKR